MGCDEFPSAWAPTMNVRDSESFDDVIQAELREIALRRAVQKTGRANSSEEQRGSTVSPTDQREDVGSPQDLVGVALSGGGLRSASISLGFLQALYDEGILKDVDYLSTVSGGGYAGALLTSTLEATRDVNWDPKGKAPAHGKSILPISKFSQAKSSNEPTRPQLPKPSVAETSDSTSNPDQSKTNLVSEPDTSALPQPPLVQRIGNKAGSTFGVLGFVSRQIYGLLVTNLFVLSAIGFVVALLAWAFRWIDEPMRAITLSVWGFNSDELRAFVPTLVIGGLWIASMVFSSVWRRSGRTFPPISSFLCAATAVSAAMSILMLLSNGNNDFGARRLGLGVPDSTYDQIRTWIRNIGYGLLAAIAATMSPILAFSRIIQSGAAPQRPLHRRIFNVVSWSVLLGAPVALFYFCVRENVSNHTEMRPFRYEICRGHIRDWDRFVAFVLAANTTSSDSSLAADTLKMTDVKQGDKSDSSDLRVTNVIQGDLFSALDRHNAVELLVECRKAEAAVRRSTREDKSISRLIKCLQGLVVSQSDPQRILDEYIRYSESRDSICRTINSGYLTNSDVSKIKDLVKSDLDSQRNLGNAEGTKLASKALQIVYKLEELDVQAKSIRSKIELCRPKEEAADAVGNGHAFQNDAKLLFALQLADQVAEAAGDDTSTWWKVARNEITGKVLEEGDPEVAHWWKSTQQQFGGVLQNPDVHQGEYLREVARRILESEKQLQNQRTTESIETLRHTQNAKREVFDLLNAIQEHRWQLTEIYLGEEYLGTDLVYPVDTIFAIVVHSEDQLSRLSWAKWCLLLASVCGLLSSLNHTSMHAYYAECLGQLWIVHHPEHGVQIPLRGLSSCERGGPLHLINGTLNLYGSSQLAEKDRIGRFTFSKTHCGARRVSYKPTAEYMQGTTDLASAVAISGGAVSPVAIDNVLVRVLLTLANCRLGKWVHHPERPPYDVSWPSPLYLLWQYISSQPEDRRYLFVSDGGHNENTGISALLERRCKLIIALDASHDLDGQFTDMYHLLREARDQHGIQVTERKMKTAGDFQRMRYDQTSRYSKQHFTVFDVVYPREGSGEPQTGVLIYVKSTLTGDEGHEITSELAASKEFPHDVTADLFFSPQRFHSYRALGEHLGLSILKDEEIAGQLGLIGQRNPNPTPPQTEAAQPERPDAETEVTQQDQSDPSPPTESEVEQFIAELLKSDDPSTLLRKLGQKKSPFRSVLEAIEKWENKVGPVGFNLFKVLNDNPRAPGLKKLREYLTEYVGEGDRQPVNDSDETTSPGSKELP